MKDALRLIDEAITNLRRAGFADDSTAITMLESVRLTLLKQTFTEHPTPHPQHGCGYLKLAS